MKRAARGAASVLVVAGCFGAVPAAAQLVVPASDVLPALPQSGFGVANPLNPPSPVGPTGLATALAGPSLRLPHPGTGIAPLQQNDPTAPAILIRPFVGLTETLTDNARQTPQRTADLETQIAPGLSVSADTPRLQGVLGGSFEYDKYAIATDQDRHFINLYGNGTAIVLPDTLFADAQASISQASQLGGVGFAPVSQLPSASQSQIYSLNASPYLRKSYDGLIDGELRYRYSLVHSGNPATTLIVSPGLPAATNLADSMSHEGTLTVATGRDFQRLQSRLTLDASELESGAPIANTRLTAYDDVQYRIIDAIAALGRIGYEDINYPSTPGASTVGPAWQIGSRVDFGPDGDYAVLRYGKQERIYGLSGALRLQITPSMVVTASASRGLSSEQEDIANTLSSSSLEPSGALVDQLGLPTALVNPEFSLANGVFREKTYRLGVTETIDVNTFSLFASYDQRSTLATTLGVPPPPASKAISVNFGWTRDIRPGLSASFSVGYGTVSNLNVATASNPTNVTTIGNTSTANGALAVNYVFNETLTGSVAYTAVYQTGAPTVTGGNTITTGNILTNRLSFILSKTF